MPTPFLTPEQYLEIERKAEYKSEYYQGEMFAMAGTSPNHNRLITRLVREVSPQLDSRGCEGFFADIRVRVSASGLYTYPDYVVVCGGAEFTEDYTLLNPVAVVEVLSPSTEAYDRGWKLEQYATIPGLKQYAMVAQEFMSVHVLNLPEGKLDRFTKPDDVVTIHPGAQIRLADLYAGIEFQARTGMRPLG